MVVMADLVAAAAQLLNISSSYALLTISLLLLPAALYFLLLSPTTGTGRSAGGNKQLQSIITTISGRRDKPSTKQKQQQLPLPPSPPGGLPIIGHLHLLMGPHQQQPHVALRDLATTHACEDLMLLRLGAVANLVVSSARAAEAVMRTYDHVFASRPPSTLVDVLMRGAADVALAPYGEQWRQNRKLVTAHLLTVKKVASFRRARQEEARLAIAKIFRDLRQEGGVVVDVSDLLYCFANDIVCRAVSGKFVVAAEEEGGGGRKRRNELFRELIAMNVAFLDGFKVEDYFPWLARSFLYPLTRVLCGNNKATNKWQQGWHDLLDKLIDGHAAANKSSSTRNDQQQEDDDDEAHQQQETDFIDVLLSLQQEYGLTRNHMKAILIDMFAAGTDTSYITMEFALVELVRNPRVLAKLQAEVRTNTPKGHDMVTEDNLSSMTYLKAVIKETLRLHPPVPLLLPRHSMADCSIDGYMIPAQTRVIVNAWAISRDPRSWDRPEEFMPERFMTSSTGIDFKGSDFQFTPFGAGRRMCPGLNFGMAAVEIMLANLIYCFDWELPPGVGKQDIDMTDVFGLTMPRKEKLLLVPKPYV